MVEADRRTGGGASCAATSTGCWGPASLGDDDRVGLIGGQIVELSLSDPPRMAHGPSRSF